MATIQATDWLNRDKIIRRGADVKLRNVYNSGFGEREAWKDNLQGNLVIDGNNGDGAPNDFAALTHIELRGVNGQEANKMELTGLTLRNLPNLRFLIVENNHLANLDLAGARNLISLDISDNTELVNLDLRPTPNLFSLDLHGSGVNPINIQGLGQLGQLRTWNGGSDIATDGYKVIPLGGNAKTAVLAEIERLRVAHDDLPEVPIGDFCVQLLLHRPQGGAGVENDGTGLNGGHDQAAIDNWINQAADDENNTLDKLHEARKVLTRMRAQVRINNYLGNDPVITPQELKDEINRLDPNTIPPVDVEATWETWLRRARNEADVERKEQRLIKALASLKKGKQARKALAYEEVEALRAHVGLADADFKAELRKPIADGGANAATEGDGDAGTRTLRDTGNANQDWQNWLTIAADTDAETNPKKEIALRILRRRQAVARVNAELGTITNDDLKNRINDATGLPGSIGANTIQPADSWKVWMDKSADLDTVYNRETQLITALTYLKAGGQNRKALAYEEVEALRAHVGLADADFKAELRKPIADGGANAATEGDGDAGTRTLRDTGNANQDWQNWLTIAADTDAETNPKKEIALRILRRRQAVARVNAELGTITNDDLKNRINDATGLPGSIGANTIQPADSWKVWMDKSADLDTVYNRETQLITALTYLKAGGQNRKALAYEEVEALRAHVGLADADFKAELRKPIADGGANAATEGDGDAGTRTLRDTGNANQDWQNWLTIAADTDAETNPKKEIALRILRRRQAVARVNAELGTITNDDLKNRINDATGLPGSIGANTIQPADSWKVWMDKSADLDTVYNRETQLITALTYLKAGGQNRKALAYEEVEALRAHVGLADADFKAELRKPIADGGANAATEGDGDAGTRTLRDTGNANQDWQNWLTRAADTDEETNTKKSNALRVLRRIQYAENIIDEVKGYLNDPATGAKDDAALNTELNRPLNTGGGQALNIGGAGPASWKAWLREGASPHQALERGILAMKAAVIVKNADRKVSDKLLEASLAKIELYRKAHQDYKGTDLPEIGYDVLIQALVNEGADNGPDGFNGGTDKTAFVTWMGKSVPAGFLGRWWGTGTEAKEVKDIELKEEQVLTIIARKRAIARLEALQNTLGVSHEDFVKKLKQAPNQGGISADATLDETAAGAEAAWHSLFNGLNKVELVTSKETEMAQSLGVAKGGVAGGGDLKAAAIDEVDVAFTAARTAIPAFTHTVFKTELNNKAAAAIGDTATDDNVAWHAWLNAAANDTQTAQRKNTALKVIAAYRAINRVESLFDANVDAAKLGTELRKTDGDGGGIGYVGFGFGGVHANYINAAPDVEAVAEREGKVMKAIGILKAGGTQKTRADGYANDITGLLTGTDGTDGSDPANWKTQLKSKLDDLKNIKTFAKDKLGFDLDAVPYSGNLSSLKTAIENKLGTSKLSDITTGNLTDLINKPDTSTLTNQLNQEKQKVTDFETKLGVKLNELDGKLGSKKLSNIPDGKTLEKLLQEDPTALQTKIDQLNAQLNDKEKEVVKSIHDALSLGIAEGSITKDEVLKKIREKIVGGGGDTQKDQQIKDLTAEVNNLKNQTNTIVKEVVVEKIVDNTKAQETYGFTFTTAEQEQIKSAGSAKEALAKTNEIIKGKMETLQSSKKTANTLNWVLGGLSVVSLVWLAYLLVKGSSGLLSEGDEKKEGEK